MSERSSRISRLIGDRESRIGYIRAKLAVLIPAQIKALRLKSGMPRQIDLAREADMHQSRISAFETPGSANFTLETLARLAGTFGTGLLVKFVPFTEMLEWENRFSQDTFDVTRLEDDTDFIRPREPVSETILSTGIVAALTSHPKGNQIRGRQDIPFLPLPLDPVATSLSGSEQQRGAA